MARILVGTTPVQVLPPSTARSKFEVQVIPSSIEAGNTGLIYLATDNPPHIGADQETYDEVLNAGAAIARSLQDGDNKGEVNAAVWLVSDTADQIVNVKEFLVDEQAE